MGAANARLRHGPPLTADPPWTEAADGVHLAVRLTPRGGRNAVEGLAADASGRNALRIRIGAPPVEGAANRALIAFLADALGLRAGDVVIRSGEGSRLKRVHLTGSPSAIIPRLAALISPAPPAGRSPPPRRSS